MLKRFVIMIEFGNNRSGSEAPRRVERNDTEVKSRRMTDKLCLLLFAVMIGFIAFMTIRDIKTVEFKKLIMPKDGDGRICGEGNGDSDLTAYPYLYVDYPEKGNSALTRRVCVRECPSSSSETLHYMPTRQIPSAQPFAVYSTKLVAGKLCLPSDLSFYKSLSDRMYSIDSSAVFEAAASNYKLIALSMVLALVFSFFYSKLLAHCAFCVVLASFGIAYGGIAVIGLLSFNKHGDLLRDSESASDSIKMKQAAASYKVIAHVLWGMAAGLTLLTIMMISRIRAAVGVLQTASRFMNENKPVVLLPVFGFIAGVFVVAAWIISALAFYSRVAKTSPQESESSSFQWKDHKKYAILN